MLSVSAVVYLLMLPISFFHYQKLKKQNQDKDSIEEDDDLEDVL
jgi:CDP-diacylglycerol--serine O-phosphatidyltransferase